MSKLTNAMKLQARTRKKPRKRAHNRGPKNPAFKQAPASEGLGLLADPIALHHIAGFLLRALELYPPQHGGMGEFPEKNFVLPEDVAPKSEVN